MSLQTSIESHAYWKSHLNYVCKECGSQNYHLSYVVHIENGNVYVDISQDEEPYCRDCDDEVELKEVKPQ